MNIHLPIMAEAAPLPVLQRPVTEFVFGDLRFDLCERAVFKGNRRLSLFRNELRSLEYMVIRRPSLVSVQILATHLFDRECLKRDRKYVHVCINRTRDALAEVNSVVTLQSKREGSCLYKYWVEIYTK